MSANLAQESSSDPLMRTPKSQLCDRARQLASARLDGEISELEGALLDAHLARCASCSSFALDCSDITGALRAAALVRPEAPVGVALPHRGTRRVRLLQTAAATALVLVAAALGSALSVFGDSTSGSGAPAAQRHTAMLAFTDTPDQLRRLRRPVLIESGLSVPRNRAFIGDTV
jgi:predicted anti-sigma-YlaC factor YlaD